MNVRTAGEFVVGFRVQREWRWLILTAFFLGGLGGGLFMVSAFAGFAAGMLAGLLVVIVGKGTAHLLFLGRPGRFWRAAMRVLAHDPRRSYTARMSGDSRV